MKLTKKSAKDFALKFYVSKFKKDQKKFVLDHLLNVEKCCLILSKGKKVDTNSLIISAWLHDIGRVKNKENHAKISLEITKEKFDNVNEIICDCILNHGSDSKPKTKEGKLFQLADKMSLITPESFYFCINEKKLDFFEKKLKKVIDLAKKLEDNK